MGELWNAFVSAFSPENDREMLKVPCTRVAFFPPVRVPAPLLLSTKWLVPVSSIRRITTRASYRNLAEFYTAHHRPHPSRKGVKFNSMYFDGWVIMSHCLMRTRIRSHVINPLLAWWNVGGKIGPWILLVFNHCRTYIYEEKNVEMGGGGGGGGLWYQDGVLQVLPS